MDWDYFRFFLELARTGRLAHAARRLEVDQATVSRRVQALERDLGKALFVRTSGGMGLTDAGRALLSDAEAMEASAGRILGTAHAHSGHLAGVVRIGATEGFGTVILAPQLAGFATKHPQLTIDLVAVSAVVNISRREADIVISLDRPKRGPFVVVRLCEYALQLYGSHEYLQSRPPLRSLNDLRHHSLIGYVDDLLFSKQLQFVNEIQPPERFALRSTSVVAQRNAAAAGAGLAVLPIFLAHGEPRLKAVLASEVQFRRTFWMSMPAEVKDLPRIRATWDFLREAVVHERHRLLPDS